GQAWLGQAASPEALVATSGGQLLALKRDLEADRQALRSQVENALKGKQPKTDEKKVEKEVAALSKKVDDLTKKVADLPKQLENLEKLTKGSDGAPILDKFDQAFAALLGKIEQRLEALPAAQPRTADSPQHLPPAGPSDSQVSTAPVPEQSLVQVLHAA